MPIKERDIVLQGRDGGQDTIDLPITRLGNVESGAEVKEAPAQGDYIPIIDGADSEQMKKFPAGWLMNAVGGSGGGGSAAGSGELDLERSRIGGKSLALYTEEFPLTEEGAGVELTVDVASGALSQDGEGNWFVNGVELWVKEDENGLRRGTVEIRGTDRRWPVRTADEEAPQGCPAPVELTEGIVNTTLITSGKTVDAPCRSGVLEVTVALEDGTVKTRYAIRVRCVGGDRRVESVTLTSHHIQAEPQCEVDGSPLRLTLAQAEERYGRMAEIAAKHDPCRSYGMTELERSRYYDNGDPRTGRPIRRRVYRGCIHKSSLHAANSPATVNAVRHPQDSPYKGVLPVASVCKGTGLIINRRLPYTTTANFVMPGEDGSNCPDADPMTYPLIGNFAVEGTEDWDKVCGRIYFQVDAGGEEVEYGVLEVYNTEPAGNCRLGRVELDGRGLPQKDPEAWRMETLYESNTGPYVERQGVDVLLKKAGGPVDREKDRFALWAWEEGTDFRGDVPPSAYAVGEWSEEPAFPPEDVGADRPVPAKLRLWVSAEAEKVYVTARTEEPEAWLSGNLEKRGFRNHKRGKYGLVRRTDKVVDGEFIYEYRSGMAVDLAPEAGPGEKAGTVYLHVKAQDDADGLNNETNSGRIYEVELLRGWPERQLVKAELMGEDGESVLAAALPETVEGEEKLTLTTAGGQAWVRLTCGESAGGEEIPKGGKSRIYLFRKDGEGNFSTGMSQAIQSCPEKAAGGADLEALGWDQSGVCWARLAASTAGTEYRVVVTDATGLQDSRAKSYTLTLTKVKEAEA